jgi:hypothetical protein
MTTSELKRAMDRRFDRLERATNRRFDRFERMTDRRFDRLERTKVDKAEFRKAIADLRSEITASAAETRRYFEVVADDMMSRIRVYGDGIAAATDRLENHETRITKLERRSS